MAAALWEQGAELVAKNLKFVEEDIKIHDHLRPKLATPNQVRLDLRTMVLRDYGKQGGIPTLVDAPHAGHTAMIADYHKGQSLVETLLANGLGHVTLTDWKTATDDMKDLEIDNYLAELIVTIGISMIRCTSQRRRRSRAGTRTRSTCWPVHPMTSPRRRRYSMPPSTSERHPTASCRRPYRAATSGCSWKREP